jgi:hypothetical protein
MNFDQKNIIIFNMKNTVSQKLCIFLDGLLPRWFVVMIYYPSWYIFKALASIHFNQHLSCSYLRNSFYLDYLTFGLSDLDFGVVLKRRVPSSTWKEFHASYLYFKKIFPFWGEINLYCEDELSLISPFFNSIEAQRDPFIASFKFKENHADKLSFLLRSIMTNMSNWPIEMMKEKKFKTYFKLCGLPFKKTETVESTLSINLGDLLLTPLQKKIPQFSIKFHGLIKNSPDILWDLIFEEQKTFFPQHYLWFERGEDDEKFIQRLDQSDKNVLISQANWEIWGLYTQLYYFHGTENFKIHLSRMKKVLSLAGCHEQNIKKIDEILARFDEMK